MKQFLRFCAVGVVGFMIDAGILQLLVSGVDANPYLARIISFLAAVNATWIMNRRYTFKVEHSPTQREWARYIAFMACGALVNYLAFAVSITIWALAHAQPWVGVAVGSIAGLSINFLTSRLLVFRTI